MSIETSYLEQGLRNSQISLPQKRRSIAIFYDKTISPSCQPTADFMAWLGREMCKIDGEGGSPRNVLGPSTGFAEAGNNITDISSFALPFPSSRSAPSLRRDAGCLLTTEMQKCFAAASRQASNSQGRLLSMPRMPNARKGHGWRQRMRFRRARVSEEGGDFNGVEKRLHLAFSLPFDRRPFPYLHNVGRVACRLPLRIRGTKREELVAACSQPFRPPPKAKRKRG